MINSFDYVTPENEKLATALYLTASAFDHSCQPNSGFTFEKGKIVVRAHKNIEISEDEDITKIITLSYIDLLDSVR